MVIMKTYTRDLIRQSAKDLLAKNLFPQRSTGLLTELNNLNAAIKSVESEFVHEWKCPKCMIVVFGPKKWMIEDRKLHAEKGEMRENEIKSTNFKIY